MTPASLVPRERDPDSWQLWLREGAALWRRGAFSWAPLQITVTLVMVAVLTHAPVLGVLVGAAMGPLFGVYLAAVESLAKGRTGILAVMDAMAADARAHARPYFRSFLWRVFFLSLLQMLRGQHGMSEPLQFWFACMDVVFLWGVGQSGRITGCVGFYPWLAWKHHMDPKHAFLINKEARLKNDHALGRLNMIFLMAFLLTLVAPFLLLLVEPLWAATLRSAYADIFNQDPGVRVLQEAKQAPNQLATASTQARA